MSTPVLLKFGYVSKAHGLKGELAVRTFDPSSSVLDEIDRVHVLLRTGESFEKQIEGVRDAPKGDLLICLAGVEYRDQAEKFVGATLSAFREDLPAPDDGEFFQGDLVGLTVVDEAGVESGSVREVWSSGPVPNLVIDRTGHGEVMVPFIDEYVLKIDLEKGQCQVRWPEYLE